VVRGGDITVLYGKDVETRSFDDIVVCVDQDHRLPTSLVGFEEPDLEIEPVIVLDCRVHQLWRYALLTADYGVQTLLLFLRVGDPDERDDEGVEAVVAVTRIARAGSGDPTSADDLCVGVAQSTQAHALDEDVPNLIPIVRRTQTQMLHRALEALEVIFEAEEAAAPDVGHVIGRVRAQESPV
jgi:hypothetical protein